MPSLQSEYIKLAFIIIALMVIIYFVATMPAQTPPANSEQFSPYISTLAHDIKRSDPAFDIPQANIPGRSSEHMLFNQLNGWAMFARI